MTRLAVKYHGLNAMIVGYCPDNEGAPRAIMICNGELVGDYLCEVQLEKLPKRLRKKRFKSFHRKAEKVD